MRIFAGLAKTDYQDILRAVGLLLDQQRLRDIRIWEHEEGIIVQGRKQGDESARYESILLSDEDLQALLADAYRRRQAKSGLLESSFQ
jgi:hypothetical protein